MQRGEYRAIEEILQGCREGDPEAFAALFERHKDQVWGLAYHLSRDADLAEDLTQQVFLKLFDKVKQFRGQSEFSTWLHRVVVNAFLDHKRRKRPDYDLEDAASAPALQHDAPQERRLARKELSEKVRRGLQMLSVKLRTPLVLRYLGGLSYQEIAQVLDLSPGTVASRISRGHARLAEVLEHLREEVAEAKDPGRRKF